MNILQGKECMVQAVISAADSMEYLRELQEIRTRQLVESFNQPFNLQVETTNLLETLHAAQILGELSVQNISGLASITPWILEKNLDVFLGFQASPDNNKPHIHHVKEIVSSGLNSKQGFLRMDVFTEAYMNQTVTGFINTRRPSAIDQ